MFQMFVFSLCQILSFPFLLFLLEVICGPATVTNQHLRKLLGKQGLGDLHGRKRTHTDFQFAGSEGDFELCFTDKLHGRV